MERLLKEELQCQTVKGLSKAGGCISEGQTYLLDDSQMVFVKRNNDIKAQVMYEGEMAGLQAIYNTGTVRVPKPIKIFSSNECEWVFVMEHIEMRSLERYGSELGKKLAQLHLHIVSLKDKSLSSSDSVHCQRTPSKGDEVYVDKFGFGCDTSCGLIPMPNHWESNWIEFYTRNSLKPQVDLILKEYGDRQVVELWSQLQLKIPIFFKEIPSIQPSLLHGDLWSGNSGETNDEPIIFDPGSFYGHHEFDLSIAKMFAGFSRDFYSSYHSLIPMSPGFESRVTLYQLFHYLNHWNHFGAGYRSQSITLMKELLK